MTRIFPCPDRGRSARMVHDDALVILKLLHEHIDDLGGDADSRHFYSYAVALAILQIVDQPRKRQQRTECDLIANRVSEFVTRKGREERDAERAAGERERRTRVVIQLRDRINSAFKKAAVAGSRTSSTGDEGPGPRAA